MATCPDCGFDEIETEDLDEGDTLTCPECGKSLEFLGGDDVEVIEADDLDDDDDLEDDEDEEEEDDEDEDDGLGGDGDKDYDE